MSDPVDVSGPVSRTQRPKTKSGVGPLESPVAFGRYTLTHVLGRGGMAEVFLAKQAGLAGFNKQVVIKRIRGALIEEERFVQMFLREARIAAQLNHVNTVQIFELGEVEGEYFIAMEFIDGLAIHRAARRSWAHERSIPLEVVLRVVADAGLGLHHAHTLTDDEGAPTPLIHRDVSPDNLMLTRAGVTKVLDFGIAKPGGKSSEVTETGEIKGKIPFMSPEQIHGEPLAPAADMWSLGITLYWLLTGRRPFDGKTDAHTIDKVLRSELVPPRQINPLIPAPVQVLVQRLLERDPTQRLSSGQVLHDEIVKLLGPAAGTGAAREWIADILELDPVEARIKSTSVITIVAACPVSEWLKRDEVSSLNVESRIPLTPSSGSHFELSKNTPATHSRSIMTEPRPKRRAFAAAVGVTAALAVAGVATWAVLEHESDAGLSMPPLIEAPAVPDEPKLEPKVEAVVEPVVEAPVQPVVELDSKPVAELKPRRKVARRSKPTPEPTPVATRSVVIEGPASVSWYLGDKRVARGAGRATVPDAATHLLAVDSRTGARTRVAIDERLDYGALSTGRASFRVRPSARVRLGSRDLGETPFDPVKLVVGSYTATLTTSEGIKREVKFKVTAGGHEIIKADLRN